jgi:Nif-specific regulatory protein
LGLQAKLLRVLEERSITRVGSNKATPVDVRIVVASHKNLQQSVNEGKFRLDLFYRLNVFPIELPPLRNRAGDIRLLARNFLNQANQEYGVSAMFDRGALEFLERYTWPGNIRQLENVIKRSVLLADDNHFMGASLMNAIIIEESGIEQPGMQSLPSRSEFGVSHPASMMAQGSDSLSALASREIRFPADDAGAPRAYWRVADSEREQLLRAFEMAKGNKTRAAHLMEMTPRQFNYRWKKLGL